MLPYYVANKDEYIIDTHVPAEVIDEAIRRRQLELPDETLRHWEVLDVAMQQLSVELVKLLAPIDVNHGGDRPRNRKDDDRLYIDTRDEQIQD